MDLERQFIERSDFATARRGYDPAEVDRHLREVADAVESLERSEGAPAPSAGFAVADHVRGIVEAAERSADAMRAQAERDADRIRQGARDRSSAEVEEAREASSRLLQRIEETEADLDRLVDGVRAELESLADAIRASARSLASEPAPAGGLVEPAVDAPRAAHAEPLEAHASATDSGALSVPTGAAGADQAEGATAEAAYRAAPEERAAREEVTIDPEAAAPEAGLDQGQGFDRENGEDEDATRPPTASGEEGFGAPMVGSEGGEGARLIALNMALNGTPREETARYLAENFEVDDAEGLLDDVYARAGG